LTIYFYHNIKSYELFKKNICEYIKQNKDTLKILKISIFQEITMETVDKLIGDNEMYKEFIFDILTKNIKIIKNQLNTSFIDILNLDNVFKIGYSGTINMSLPKNTILIPDNDENKNVSYAISQSKINYEYDQINILNKMNHYNILIDICGLFSKELNVDIAKKINNITKKNVIFISENNEKLVYSEEYIVKYNSNNKYDNVIIYYDQGHTIGIDIKSTSLNNIGYCIIDENTKYTDIAQGIFRMRNINIDQKIDICIYNSTIKLDNTELLLKLNTNETNYKNNLKIYNNPYSTVLSTIYKI
jgi:hypothetical protein